MKIWWSMKKTLKSHLRKNQIIWRHLSKLCKIMVEIMLRQIRVIRKLAQSLKSNKSSRIPEKRRQTSLPRKMGNRPPLPRLLPRLPNPQRIWKTQIQPSLDSSRKRIQRVQVLWRSHWGCLNCLWGKWRDLIASLRPRSCKYSTRTGLSWIGNSLTLSRHLRVSFCDRISRYCTVLLASPIPVQTKKSPRGLRLSLLSRCRLSLRSHRISTRLQRLNPLSRPSLIIKYRAERPRTVWIKSKEPLS